MPRARHRTVIALVAVLAIAAPACASIPEPGSTGSPPIGELVTGTGSTSTTTTAAAATGTPLDPLPDPAPTTATTSTVPASRTCAPESTPLAAEAADRAVAAAGAIGSARPATIPGSAPLLHDRALVMSDGEEMAYRATIDVRRLGLGDVVAISDVRYDSDLHPTDPTVVLGNLPSGTGRLTPMVTLTRCHVGMAASDATTAWLAGAVGSAAPDELVAIDLATGAERWRWTSSSTLRSLSTQAPDTIQVVDGGAGDHQPFVVTTFAAGTGAVVATTSLPRFGADTLVESDGAVWLASRPAPTRDERPTATTYRRFDPTTGSVTAELTVPDGLDADGRPVAPTWAGAVGPWLWRIADGRLERWSTTDGTVRTFELGSQAHPGAIAAVGPSGLWVLATTGPAGRDGLVVHATSEGGGGDGASVVGPFAVDLVRDHRGPNVIDLSRLVADHHGFTYRDTFDGGYEFGSATTWAFDLAPPA